MKSPLASTPPSPSQARRSPLSRRRRKIHASTPVTPAAPHLTGEDHPSSLALALPLPPASAPPQHFPWTLTCHVLDFDRILSGSASSARGPEGEYDLHQSDCGSVRFVIFLPLRVPSVKVVSDFASRWVLCFFLCEREFCWDKFMLSGCYARFSHVILA